MSHASTRHYLTASRELLLTAGQANPALSAETYAALQEAVEHIDRAQRSLGPDDE